MDSSKKAFIELTEANQPIDRLSIGCHSGPGSVVQVGMRFGEGSLSELAHALNVKQTVSVLQQGITGLALCCRAGGHRLQRGGVVRAGPAAEAQPD